MKMQVSDNEPGQVVSVSDMAGLRNRFPQAGAEPVWQDSLAHGSEIGVLIPALLRNMKDWLEVRDIVLAIERGDGWGHAQSAAWSPQYWSASGASDPADADPCRPPETVELRFAGRRLGTLKFFWSAGAGATLPAFVSELVRRLGWVVLRYLFQSASFGPMSRSTLWIGAGHAIQRFTERLEVAVRSHFPVYIAGEFGTDPSSIAWAMHALRCGFDAPFVEIRGSHPEGTPAEWFARAKGGTLYINGIQDMAPALLCELPGYLQSRLGQWASSPPREDACQLVSSGVLRAEQLMCAPEFPRALMAELSLVELHVPPLRARIDDFRALFSHVCQCVGQDIELHCDDDVWQYLERHVWPENQLELTRLVAQLALSVQNRAVRYADLAHCVPTLVPRMPPAAVESLLSAAARSAPATLRETPPPKNEHSVGPGIPVHPAAGSELVETCTPCTASSWAHYVLQGEQCAGIEGEMALPRALVRALRHLSQHYSESLTQPDLAAVACTSASHLAALFRQHLGVNFKTLLQHIRVLRARHLLCEAGVVRVSDVAIGLGFADLSHFERCFKRITGYSPREYRMRFAP
ncbi:helix-turn-helix domain-containing protein [Bordetella genomosp. 13]|uniref:helix-turn-helix domain-containing protein n=1 Tax=Bordetella genomosp. 13 TaxID=463040 RepID=UPI00119E0922|nr:helix-turn-helix domain-containing protein [Bordetella genomosp. 13]